jgi:ribonuclease HII
MQGRTWKDVKEPLGEKIKLYLLENGGEEQKITSAYEAWRVKFSDSTFIYYKNGTLHAIPSNSKDPAVVEAWKYIDSLVISYIPPTKDFLIGLDETGKGEVIGHTILTGVIFPKEIFDRISLMVGPADTKKRHEFLYWDSLFRKLDQLRNFGLNFITEKIPPWEVDKYNLNKIMDVTYQKILSIFFRKVKINQCRIVLDDYGFGLTLKRFLKFLEHQGAEIIVTHNADEKYLEVKVASLISKRTREAVIEAIKKDPELQVNGLSIGSGNANDPRTLKWLERWHQLGKDWPWFIKKSFKTIRQIEGKKEEPRKITPPIREELLSSEFLEKFNKGELSIKSLSVICPSCGDELKGVTFAIFEKNGYSYSNVKCPSCKNLIKDAGITLRYYCGYVVPDSSIIRRRLLSKDLEASRFFENFTIILSPVVRKECDNTRTGREELKKLAEFSSKGRIRLECPGEITEIADNLPNVVRDELIIKTCLENNAILLTADSSMYAFASGKNVFTIFT